MILTHEQMTVKLAEASTQQLLKKCDVRRIPVDYRLIAQRRDHGYEYKLQNDEKTAVAKIWDLWAPGGDTRRWVEFLVIDDDTYIEEKRLMWPYSTTAPEDPEV